jgi:hypothetical protein
MRVVSVDMGLIVRAAVGDAHARMSPDMDEAELVCHRCATVLKPGQGNFYVVRIEAVADPSPPDWASDKDDVNPAREWERLLDQIRDMSERELLDQVYRRMVIHLCISCYRDWIDDPVSKR